MARAGMGVALTEGRRRGRRRGLRSSRSGASGSPVRINEERMGGVARSQVGACETLAWVELFSF